MVKSKVIVDYSPNRYSDSELNVKAGTIGTDLTDNPAFPTLKETGAAIKTLNDTFGGLLIQMADGNKQLTLQKNETRANLEKLLGSTALKVQDISGGDEQLILSAGFDVKRKPVPVGLLDCPEKLKAIPGPTRGSLEISWDVVPNAYIYEIEYTEAPTTADSKWLRVSNTKHKIVIDSLVRGQAYAIRVAGAGTDPRRVWSDEIISYVM